MIYGWREPQMTRVDDNFDFLMSFVFFSIGKLVVLACFRSGAFTFIITLVGFVLSSQNWADISWTCLFSMLIYLIHTVPAYHHSTHLHCHHRQQIVRRRRALDTLHIFSNIKNTFYKNIQHLRYYYLGEIQSNILSKSMNISKRAELLRCENILIVAVTVSLCYPFQMDYKLCSCETMYHYKGRTQTSEY